jgi:hypothetical protein
MQHPRMVSLLWPAARMRAFMILGILACALAPLCVHAQSSISIAGRWTGTMDVTSEFGELKHYEEMMALAITPQQHFAARPRPDHFRPVVDCRVSWLARYS